MEWFKGTVSCACAGCGVAFGSMFSCILTSHGIHAQKVEPTPGVEVNPISPPAPSIIAREMANPSPVPCANSLSFWNRPNTLFCTSYGMPTPESST